MLVTCVLISETLDGGLPQVTHLSRRTVSSKVAVSGA
jgi:hypothetical protein